MPRSKDDPLEPPRGAASDIAALQAKFLEQADQASEEAKRIETLVRGKWEELETLAQWWVETTQAHAVRADRLYQFPSRSKPLLGGLVAWDATPRPRRGWSFHFRPEGHGPGPSTFLVVLDSGAVFQQSVAGLLKETPAPSWVLGKAYGDEDIVSAVKRAMAKELLKHGVVLKDLPEPGA